MFRISHYMHALVRPPETPAAAPRKPGGPVVIWNLIRRCNLTCKHCYSISADIDFPGELDTAEVYTVMDDLRGFGVPVLILSGGEPLLRPDIHDIARRARGLGFYVGLSTNGTLIDESRIGDVAAVGYDYVGISIDGTPRHPRPLPSESGRLRCLAARHPPLSRGRHQGGHALHADPGQRPRAAADPQTHG